MSAKTESINIAAEERVFLLRRLHSLTGIVPIGGFLLFHFFENSSARHGAEAFNETVVNIGKMPYVYALEVFTLILPILFHSIYGLFITTSSRPNLMRQSYLRNWLYFLQRLSGYVAFAYIFYHIWTTRVWALYVKNANITYADMNAMLSNPMVYAFYLLGIAAVTFHFANGLWGFSITWGLVRTRVGQKRLTVATLVLFVLLCAWGFDIASAFRYGKSYLSFLGV
jgi:succinate dehydrogenase / fumarate reductase cytochrome b subunit